MVNSGNPSDRTNAWGQWATTTASTSNSVVWMGWATTSGTSSTGVYAPAYHELTPEEQRAADERQRVYQEEANKKAEARKIADAQAEKLLLDHLGFQQKADWMLGKKFSVKSQSGRKFILHFQRNKNIMEIDAGGRQIGTFCIVANDNIPICDQLVMQKLMLEHHEEDFVKIAIKW